MTTRTSKAVVFGAGNIGRGYMAPLLQQSGYDIVFVDADAELVSLLNQAKEYTIRLIGDETRDLTVSHAGALQSAQEAKIAREIASAQLVITTVGPGNLPFVAPLIAEGVTQRIARSIKEPLNVIACENMPESSTSLKKLVLENMSAAEVRYVEEHVGFPDATLSRIVADIDEELKKQDPLLIITEDLGEWTADKYGFRGEIPNINGLEVVENEQARFERKFYLHNTGHAMCGYLGYFKGYQYMHEAIRDQWIEHIVWGALKESGVAVRKEHGFSEHNIQRYCALLIKRTRNEALQDTVARVTRNPIRKLGPTDRFIKPANLALSYGICPSHLSTGIAAVFFYDGPRDQQAKELTQMLEKRGITGVLEEICEVDRESKLAHMVEKEYESLKAYQSSLQE